MKYSRGSWWMLSPEDREILVSLLTQEADDLEYDRRFAVTEGMRARIRELRQLAERLSTVGAPGA